ncbi:MAG: DUF4474 domain-containing protein [Clostridia bacterium]|nr:DUF4474 domain-containing protein [Clostridia bacterium]
MKNKALTIAVAAVAVALICVVAVLGVKMSNGSPSSVPAEGSVYHETQESSAPLTDLTEESVPESTGATVAESTTAQASTVQASTEQTAAPSTQAATKPSTTVSNKAFKEVFTLPRAPQYVPPDVDIDFAKVNLVSYKYNPDGNYYYTDDKECWQKNFGFNEVYDAFAPVTMMYYDTVRTTFEYGGKEWLIQTWKGQYGMAFVGGEVGVYTRPLGSIGSHYVCADKSDWLNMEMAFMWDEYETGEYRAVFNRNYEKYWWATGFVVGFPNGSLRQTLKEFRLVTHITFKDTEMANAFCEAFEANGFRRVSKLNNNEPDTFVQVGPDVAFVWQNINHK